MVEPNQNKKLIPQIITNAPKQNDTTERTSVQDKIKMFERLSATRNNP